MVNYFTTSSDSLTGGEKFQQRRTFCQPRVIALAARKPRLSFMNSFFFHAYILWNIYCKKFLINVMPKVLEAV